MPRKHEQERDSVPPNCFEEIGTNRRNLHQCLTKLICAGHHTDQILSDLRRILSLGAVTDSVARTVITMFITENFEKIENAKNVPFQSLLDPTFFPEDKLRLHEKRKTAGLQTSTKKSYVENHMGKPRKSIRGRKKSESSKSTKCTINKSRQHGTPKIHMLAAASRQLLGKFVTLSEDSDNDDDLEMKAPPPFNEEEAVLALLMKLLTQKSTINLVLDGYFDDASSSGTKEKIVRCLCTALSEEATTSTNNLFRMVLNKFEEYPDAVQECVKGYFNTNSNNGDVAVSYMEFDAIRGFCTPLSDHLGIVKRHMTVLTSDYFERLASRLSEENCPDVYDCLTQQDAYDIVSTMTKRGFVTFVVCAIRICSNLSSELRKNIGLVASNENRAKMYLNMMSEPTTLCRLTNAALVDVRDVLLCLRDAEYNKNWNFKTAALQYCAHHLDDERLWRLVSQELGVTK